MLRLNQDDQGAAGASAYYDGLGLVSVLLLVLLCHGGNALGSVSVPKVVCSFEVVHPSSSVGTGGGPCEGVVACTTGPLSKCPPESNSDGAVLGTKSMREIRIETRLESRSIGCFRRLDAAAPDGAASADPTARK